jgi:hypothetical protein
VRYFDRLLRFVAQEEFTPDAFTGDFSETQSEISVVPDVATQNEIENPPFG